MTPEQQQAARLSLEHKEANGFVLEAMGIPLFNYEDKWGDKPFPKATWTDGNEYNLPGWIVWRSPCEDGKRFNIFAPDGAAAREEAEEWLLRRGVKLSSGQVEDRDEFCVVSINHNFQAGRGSTLPEARASVIVSAVRAMRGVTDV